MKITIHNQIKTDLRPIRQILKQIFASIEEQKSMEIVFVSPKEIQRLNKQYRNLDKPTDVLSFINEDDIESLGDIFICYEKAIEQAKEYGHSLNREIGFLAVHGYLHLNGYDHHTKDDEAKMIKKQEEILKNANLERN